MRMDKCQGLVKLMFVLWHYNHTMTSFSSRFEHFEKVTLPKFVKLYQFLKVYHRELHICKSLFYCSNVFQMARSRKFILSFSRVYVPTKLSLANVSPIKVVNCQEWSRIVLHGCTVLYRTVIEEVTMFC